MLDEQDIQKLAQVFATKAELQAAMDNRMAKNDEILNAIDAYANKADTYYQEMLTPTKWIGMSGGFCSLPKRSV